MNRFTEREDELLIKYHEQGMPLNYQAKQLNRPYGSICTRRKALGLKYHTGGRGPAKPATTYEEISDADYQIAEDFVVLRCFTGIAYSIVAAIVGLIFYGVFFV